MYWCLQNWSRGYACKDHSHEICYGNTSDFWGLISWNCICGIVYKKMYSANALLPPIAQVLIFCGLEKVCLASLVCKVLAPQIMLAYYFAICIITHKHIYTSAKCVISLQ